MLRFHKIPFYDGNFSWEINLFTGSLLKSEFNNSEKAEISKEIAQALHFIKYPYELKWEPVGSFVTVDAIAEVRISSINNILFYLGNKRFFLSILFSIVGKKYFERTAEAFTYISKLKNHHYGSENCFQRSLLAAKLSKSFKNNGIIFIGAELSTFDMHAWIIENGAQPDFEDRVWINYHPLLAITF